MAVVMRHYPTMIWIVLMLATCLTWWSNQGNILQGTVVVTVIAAFKARLVILHFMELKTAPFRWRLTFEVWTALSAGAILLGYWLGAR